MNDVSMVELFIQNPELSLPPFALMVGKFIKQSKVKDKYIPVIVVVLTALFGFLVLHRDIDSLVKGLIYGVVTVGGHASFHQLGKTETVPNTGTKPDEQLPKH